MACERSMSMTILGCTQKKLEHTFLLKPFIIATLCKNVIDHEPITKIKPQKTVVQLNNSYIQIYQGTHTHTCIHIPNWIFDSYSSPKCVKQYHLEFLDGYVDF